MYVLIVLDDSEIWITFFVFFEISLKNIKSHVFGFSKNVKKTTGMMPFDRPADVTPDVFSDLPHHSRDSIHGRASYILHDNCQALV